MRQPLAAGCSEIAGWENKSTTLGLPPGKHGKTADLLLHCVYLGEVQHHHDLP